MAVDDRTEQFNRIKSSLDRADSVSCRIIAFSFQDNHPEPLSSETIELRLRFFKDDRTACSWWNISDSFFFCFFLLFPNQSFPSSWSMRSRWNVKSRPDIFHFPLWTRTRTNWIANRLGHLTACVRLDGGEAATRRSPKNKIIGSILCGTVTRRSARAKFNYASRIYLNTLVQACCWLGSEEHDDAPPPIELLRESPSFSKDHPPDRDRSWISFRNVSRYFSLCSSVDGTLATSEERRLNPWRSTIDTIANGHWSSVEDVRECLVNANV